MCVCSYGVRFMLWATTMSMQRRYTHIMMVARVHSIPISSTLHGLANLQSILSFLFVKHVVVIAIRSITPFDAGWSGCCCCCCSGVIVTMKKKNKTNYMYISYKITVWFSDGTRASAEQMHIAPPAGLGRFARFACTTTARAKQAFSIQRMWTIRIYNVQCGQQSNITTHGTNRQQTAHTVIATGMRVTPNDACRIEMWCTMRERNKKQHSQRNSKLILIDTW